MNSTFLYVRHIGTYIYSSANADSNSAKCSVRVGITDYKSRELLVNCFVVTWSSAKFQQNPSTFPVFWEWHTEVHTDRKYDVIICFSLSYWVW